MFPFSGKLSIVFYLILVWLIFLQSVIKESPGSFKQVITRAIYYFLPLKSVNFICCGLMIHLLSVLTAPSSSKVNHSNSKKKFFFNISLHYRSLTKDVTFF